MTVERLRPRVLAIFGALAALLLVGVAAPASAHDELVGSDPAADAVVEFSVRFSRPVPVPDTDEGTEVVVAGTVKEITEDGHTRLSLTATCNGDKVLSLAQALIRKR